MASKEKFLLSCALISGIIGISLSIWLINYLDYIGVAIGAGAGIMVQNLLMAGYCYKKISINTFFSFSELNNVVNNIKTLQTRLKNNKSLFAKTSGNY